VSLALILYPSRSGRATYRPGHRTLEDVPATAASIMSPLTPTLPLLLTNRGPSRSHRGADIPIHRGPNPVPAHGPESLAGDAGVSGAHVAHESTEFQNDTFVAVSAVRTGGNTLMIYGPALGP
jgi:hypothetical protein